MQLVFAEICVGIKEGDFSSNKLSWECHTRDLRFNIEDNPHTLHKLQRHSRLRVYFIQQEKSIWWVGGWFFQEILPLRGSILQTGACKILSLAENPRWSRVWQIKKISLENTQI